MRLGHYWRACGRRVRRIVIVCAVIGILWFFIELAFVSGIQIFLVSMGLLPASNMAGYLSFSLDPLPALLLLLAFGLVRTLGVMARVYFSGMVAPEFYRYQRQRLVHYLLWNRAEVNSSDAISALTEDVTRGGLVLHHLSNSLVLAVSALAFVLFGLYMVPVQMLSGIAILLLTALPLKFLGRRVSELGTLTQSEWSAVNESIVMGLKNHLFLLLHGQLPAYVADVQRDLATYREHQAKYWRIYGLRSGVPIFIGVLTVGAITYLSTQYYRTPTFLLLTFFYAFIRVVQGLSDVGGSLSEVRFYFPSFARIADLSLKADAATPAAGSAASAEIPASVSNINQVHIQVRNMNFAFDPRHPLFTDFNLEVKPGETALIKGRSGSGKSTLLMLLLGHLRPSKGEININSKNAGSIGKELAEYLGYVGPESFFIPGTLRANLLYGHRRPERITDTDIWQALKDVGLEPRCRELPKGLDTLLTDSVQFSTGQKQRLNLARALLRKPKLLVLDEATANLDRDSEDIIRRELSRHSDITKIIVSHKGEFDQVANKTIEL